MTIPPLSDIACLLPASLALYRSRRRGSLATAALCVAAALYCGARWRLMGGAWPRLDVALCAAWPGVVAGALLNRRKCAPRGPGSGAEEEGEPQWERSRAEHHGETHGAEPLGNVIVIDKASPAACRTAGIAPESWASRTLPRAHLTALPFLIYAPALARYGSHLAPWWPTPLKAPRLALALVALLVAPTARRTLAGRVALLLAAGMAAGVAVDTWAAWESAQAALSAGVWVCAAGMVWWER